MATIIFDDTFGARTTKIFGCSFKSITAQMGFNSQPIVFTLTVVEEKDQDFTLDKNDVRSVQFVSFGELSLLGIVQSWERTTTDPAGTGIYTVRLTDCRTVLDSANIANVYVDIPDTEVALIDTNLIYIGSTGTRIADDESTVEEDKGVIFATVIERVEAATLTFGNNTFEVDMSALLPLENFRGEGVNQFFIEGEIRSLVSTITEFCNAVGAEWWVESRRKSVVDSTIVIEIKVIRRLDGIGNPNALEMDALVALHAGHIIRRKDGFESNDTTTNKVIWGGVKRELEVFFPFDIKPFWGFDQFGIPLLSPSFPLPDESQFRRIDTTIEQMEDVLNNTIGDFDADNLAALNRYMDDVWGKKFYFTLDKNTLTDSGKDLANFPELIGAGWWEGNLYPQGAKRFDADMEVKLTTEDGRWGPFVRLSEIFVTGSGTVESPIVVNYVTWAPVVHNSQNLLQRESLSFMKCTTAQFGRYIVMTLPVALTRFRMDPETGAIDNTRLQRHDVLDRAWIPLMDRGLHYGPWSNTQLALSRVPSPGKTEVSIDKDLVPWTFGVRGMLDATAQELLVDLAAKKIDTLPELSVINTGQLEVAGIPAVNIGQAVGIGGSITEVFIRFDNNGVTTRYVMNLFTRELGEFKRRKRIELEKDTILEDQKLEDEFPEINTDLELPPLPDPSPEKDDLKGPKLDTKFVYDKPEGGMGIISAKTGGPFYAVRRTNYADIDPQTFAGGLNITNSYFLSEWVNVRNLSEPENSPGLLIVGTKVTISIFADSQFGPFVPYMEITPQVFSPPPLPV